MPVTFFFYEMWLESHICGSSGKLIKSLPGKRDAISMLGQRRRQWASIDSALGEILVLAW